MMLTEGFFDCLLQPVGLCGHSLLAGLPHPAARSVLEGDCTPWMRMAAVQQKWQVRRSIIPCPLRQAAIPYVACGANSPRLQEMLQQRQGCTWRVWPARQAFSCWCGCNECLVPMNNCTSQVSRLSPPLLPTQQMLQQA
jgi:hypothetical protein